MNFGKSPQIEDLNHCNLKILNPSIKGDNIFLVGDKVTLADLALATFLSIGTVVGKYPLGRYQIPYITESFKVHRLKLK